MSEAMDVSTVSIGGEKADYEELCQHVNAISQPLASKKAAKKVLKLVKKAAAQDKNMKQGVADVHREIRKGSEGIVILAGNVYPIDVYSHVPALCEEKELPYIFVPSKEQLGTACGHKRNAVLVFIKPHESYAAEYDGLKEIIKESVLSVE